MKPAFQLLAFLFTLVLCILFLPATMGCRTTATHYRIRGGYEKQARQNAMLGRGPLCVVNGKQKRIELLGFWELIAENWPDYGEAVLTDLATGLILYYVYKAQDDDGGGGGDTINNYYPAKEAPGDAAE